MMVVDVSSFSLLEESSPPLGTGVLMMLLCRSALDCLVGRRCLWINATGWGCSNG